MKSEIAVVVDISKGGNVICKLCFCNGVKAYKKTQQVIFESNFFTKRCTDKIGR